MKPLPRLNVASVSSATVSSCRAMEGKTRARSVSNNMAGDKSVTLSEYQMS